MDMFLHHFDPRYQEPWAHISGLQEYTCIQGSCVLGFTMCSQRTEYNSGEKLGAPEEVHSLSVPVLEGLPPH